MKKIFRTLLIVVVVLLLVWFSVRRYLKSRHVMDRVVAHLQQVYGGHVKLDDVDIGLASSALNRVEFYEVDCATGTDVKTPWLSIDSFATDVSIFDLLKQEAVPTQVKVSGAKLFLRFSKDGQLLTCLPEQLALKRLETGGRTLKIGAFPLIELDDGQVTMHTEGSPDLVLTKLSLKLEKKTHLMLTGSMEVPECGKWTIGGEFEQDSSELTMRIRGARRADLGPTMARQLPFIPASVWPAPGGSTHERIELRVIYDLNQGKLHFSR